MKKHWLLIIAVLFTISILLGCASTSTASAEEYFAIGMAYYDMGKFSEAEKWLIRAKAKDKTMSASEYNLGRIAFETGRYEEAIKYFEAILKRDPENVMALKAAAYTRIRNGDLEKASALYDRLLAIVPESADDGYNHALVLFAMKRYADAEQTLKKYEFALLDNNDVLLLYARAQKEQKKVEAIDSYELWLTNNSDGKINFEYAQVLEDHEFYARALENFRSAYESIPEGSENPSKQESRFNVARLLLIADSESQEGITEMKGAVEEGFTDFETIELLLADDRISNANIESLKTIINDGKRTMAAKAAEEQTAAENEEEAVPAIEENETEQDFVNGN
ncbi:MAG: tetratricopeptide repeat protein [Treponema sp.]|nr:tetratricopeptide repeat protein [Treponema sp.]